MARILQAFEPPHGGVAEHVRALSTHLQEGGHEVTVAGPLESQIYPGLESAGIRVARVPFAGSIGAVREDRRTARALRSILGKGDFDAGHAHGMKAGILLRTTGKLARLPVLYTPHCFSFIANEYREEIGHPHLRNAMAVNVERALGALTARLICVSRFEREYADRLHIVRASRRRTIPNGVVMDRDAAPDPALLAWRGDGMLLGAVSVLRPEKGLKHLVAAAGLLKTPPSRLRLAIVGDGAERDALARQIESSGVSDRIAMFPFLGRSDPHLAALDGVVLPSDSFEALPIGVIEGMAHSLPAIGTRIGGVPELIRDQESGLLVPPGDPAALAAAMDEMAADPEGAAAMGRRGRQIAEERYSLDRMVAEVERQYLEVSARRIDGDELSEP